MITTKERATLRSMAHDFKPMLQIGKGGISETVVAQANEYLFCQELIKVKVLQNAEFNAKEVANDFAKTLEADVVSVIGNIITLYKYSDKKGLEHIKF